MKMDKDCLIHSEMTLNQMGEFSSESETDNDIHEMNIHAAISAIDDKLCPVESLSDEGDPPRNISHSRRKKSMPIKISSRESGQSLLFLKRCCQNDCSKSEESKINNVLESDETYEIKSQEQQFLNDEKDSCDTINDEVEKICNNLSKEEVETKLVLESSKWYCTKCPAIVHTLNELEAHHENAHNQSVEFKCSLCGKVYSRYRSFSRHMKLHGNPKTYACDICHKIFSQKTVLVAHATVHSDDRPHICKQCGKSFKQFSSLYCHIKSLHTEKVKFPCSICNKEFSTKHTLESHRKIHSGERNYICDICGKSFVAKGSLDYHILSHNDLKTHICLTCGKAFKTSRLLEKHSTLHTGIKPHRCDVCGKYFREKGALREHNRIHTGAMPYSCEFCGKAFRFKGILTVHRRQHTGERPYGCTDCKKWFTNWANYNKHMKRRHKNEYRPTNVSGRNKYKPPFLAEEKFENDNKIEIKEEMGTTSENSCLVNPFNTCQQTTNPECFTDAIQQLTSQPKENERQLMTLYKGDTERRIYVGGDCKMLNFFELKHEYPKDTVVMAGMVHDNKVELQTVPEEELHSNCVDVILTQGFGGPNDESQGYYMGLPYDGHAELGFFKAQ